MDMVAIRYTDTDITIGQYAIFWGGDNIALRLESLSAKFNRTPYEFLTGITKRVKKNYIDA